MRVIWLHHIVVVWLLWSLWACCVKGRKTRKIKSRFVPVLNLIGWQGGSSFLDQSRGEVKQNHSNHRLLSTLNCKNTLLHVECNSKDCLSIKTRYNSIFAGSGSWLNWFYSYNKNFKIIVRLEGFSELNLLLCDTHALNNWSTHDKHV